MSKGLKTGSILGALKLTPKKEPTEYREVMKKTEIIQFYIKTIQFYDDNGQKINDPILVE